MGTVNRKVRFDAVRDFPLGCGTSLSSSLKNSSGLMSVHQYSRDFPSGCGGIAPKIAEICTKKRLGSQSDSGSGGDYCYWRRPVGAVRSKPPMDGKMAVKSPIKVKGKELARVGEIQETNLVALGVKKPKIGVHNLLQDKGSFMVVNKPLQEKVSLMSVKKPLQEKGTVEIGPGERKQRDRVLEMLKMFRERCEKTARNERGVRQRVDMKVYSELKKERKIVNQNALLIGSVPGVEVGDKFQYRIELVIVGLHKQLQAGIDSMEYGGGRIATCIVANEGHFDKMNDANVLLYIGEGGTLARHEVGIPPDQELKSGNRALLNSMKYKKPVRVVRGLKSAISRPQKTVYVYDGLYGVEACQNKPGPQGNNIFEFRLVRYPNQPAIPWKNCRWSQV